MEEPNEQELIRQAMRVIGSRKTPRKSESSRGNIGKVNELRQKQGFPEETRAKLREAQKIRRERERMENGAVPETTEAKRPRGRPRKQADPNAATPRPKKQDAQTPGQSG
jgi:hypothetical protein